MPFLCLGDCLSVASLFPTRSDIPKRAIMSLFSHMDRTTKPSGHADHHKSQQTTNKANSVLSDYASLIRPTGQQIVPVKGYDHQSGISASGTRTTSVSSVVSKCVSKRFCTLRATKL